MPYSESDTRAKLIDPAIHARGWTEDLSAIQAVLEKIARCIERRARTSAGIYKINQANLSEVAIPLPSIYEQQRIAARLSEQMATAEKTRKALEEQLNAINALPAAHVRRAFNGEL